MSLEVMSSSPHPSAVAALIVSAFAAYNAEFRRITRRAAYRFDLCDWKALHRDAVERIELYGRYVTETVAQINERHAVEARDRDGWHAVRAAFASQITQLPDSAFVKTFFSSLTRRLFGVVGVAPDLEFLADEASPVDVAEEMLETHRYTNRGSLRLLIEEILSSLRFRSGWQDSQLSLAHVVADVKAALEAARPSPSERAMVEHIEVIAPLFYQRTRAYLVGRIRGHNLTLPLIIALANHPERGIRVDAVILDESNASIVFGYARSYFHADLGHVGAAVQFLKSMLPRKPISELFTVLGRAKQGKAERFQELMRHLAQSSDRLEHAAGERGLVMMCFTLPSYDVVFKVIRDHIPYPKTASREDVREKYRFVFRHDRAGRLVDAQEYSRMRFPLSRFAPALLEELRSEAASTVHISADDVVFDHLYIERRMTPLNLFLSTAGLELAAAAVLDYGQCLRDLAYSGIFAGDLLLKNFGVTRHGRVIFYDYDELCALSECRFRDLPAPRDDEDEMRAEVSFHVNDHDVFPETFLPFLSFDAEQREIFVRAHSELLTAQFWRDVQAKLANDEVLEILPYRQPTSA